MADPLTAAAPRTIVQPYLPGGANVHAHLMHDPFTHTTHQTKRHLYRVSRFSRIHGGYQPPDRPAWWHYDRLTDNTNTELDW